MIDYVIYCRKSTDESSGMQTQSIPDQIRKCVEYAENNGLSVANKPQDFLDFESEIEIKRENTDSDIENRRTYQETRNLYIIKEQCTAKTPWARKKRNKLIKLINKWEVKWLLSYSPDRQARNMVEGGIIIDCVDQWLLTLKYTNFHFEPNASGKMMLWIWFVFSKQYADKLSEDITRGNLSVKTKWKSLWKYKYGYTKNEDMYYIPHPKYFDLMKKAFELKIYENKSDDEIATWLNASWYKRELVNGKVKSVSGKRLWDVWRNEFYYGMYISNNAYYDLRELNPYFVPMISETEYDLLQDKLRKKGWINPKKIKERNEEYYPFERWTVTSPDGNSFTCTLPNPARHQKNLLKLRETKPKATLGDIAKPKQIHFRLMNKASEFHNLSMGFDEIEKQIIKFLDKIKIDKKEYLEYVDFAKDQADVINKQKRTEANKIQLRLNKKTTEKTNYIKRHMGIELNKDERKIYEEELEKFEIEIDVLQRDHKANNDSERNEILELTIFLDMLRRSGNYYKRATYVQKRKISKILFSNIIINNKKRLTIEVKPNFESLFFLKSGDYRLKFEQNLNIFKKSDFRIGVALLHFYSKEFNKKDYILSQLTEKQKVLYRFKET